MVDSSAKELQGGGDDGDPTGMEADVVAVPQRRKQCENGDIFYCNSAGTGTQ